MAALLPRRDQPGAKQGYPNKKRKALKQMDLQDKFKNLIWWAEQMIEATRRSYYDWIIARGNLEKQETWLYHKGRMEETMKALEMIWTHPLVTDDIKRSLWNRVYALNQVTLAKRVLL